MYTFIKTNTFKDLFSLLAIMESSIFSIGRLYIPLDLFIVWPPVVLVSRFSICHWWVNTEKEKCGCFDLTFKNSSLETDAVASLSTKFNKWEKHGTKIIKDLTLGSASVLLCAFFLRWHHYYSPDLFSFLRGPFVIAAPIARSLDSHIFSRLCCCYKMHH